MQAEQRLLRLDMSERQIVERAIRKYAVFYASQETDKIEVGLGQDITQNVRIYSAYANLLATKSIERLTSVLAFSTLALAVVTAISVLISLSLR